MLKKIALAFLLPMMAFALCDKCVPKEKIYVQLDEIFLDEGGIWIRNAADSTIVRVETIHIDPLGYYVAKEQMDWICPRCGFPNRGPKPGWGCANCDWPYDGK